MSRPVALASIALPGRRSEVREFPLPGCEPDSGWLRVSASGICGTDVARYARGLAEGCVLGHHVVGEVAELGERAAARWGVRPGDRVALEEYLPCGSCPECAAGRYRLCPVTDLWAGGRRLGTVGIAEAPSLWGGNARYLYLPPNAVLHRLPAGLSTGQAVWALPLANALDWVLGAGALRAGERMVIIGPGYHGLAAVAAARHGGAGSVVAVGLPADRARLRLAAELGAHTVELPADAAAMREAVGTADVVLDGAGGDGSAVGRGLSLLRTGGRLVLAGLKDPAGALVDTGELIRRVATVRGVRGRDPGRVTESVRLLAGGGTGLASVPTVTVDLDGIGPMLERLAAGTGPDTPHVVVRPWPEEGR